MEADPVVGEQLAQTASLSDPATKDQADDRAADYSRRKTQEILEACKWQDSEALRKLARTAGGFLTDNLRRKAWPILLGLTDTRRFEDSISARTDEKDSWKTLPRHRDEDQVQLDVNRAFIYYPMRNMLPQLHLDKILPCSVVAYLCCADQSDAELEKNKAELSDLITEVLRLYPYLCYFQGYHDICQVFMLVLERPWRARLVSRLSVLRIRDFMLTSLEPTVAQLRLIPDILNAADPKLKRHLSGTEPFYALAGTLTMYAHDIQAYVDIARLFDILLTYEPVFSIYMFAQIVLSRRDELFENDEDDPSMLHLILSKVPQKMNLEALIAGTIVLYERYPPESLPAWRRISKASSLKTARSLEGCAKQTMDDGYVYFQKQLAELRDLERRQKIIRKLWTYKNSAVAAGLAVTVGLVAMYLRRNPALLTRLWISGSNWTYNF